MRLSAQANQPGNAANQANGAQHNGNGYPPQTESQKQAYDAAGAQSVAQAISTYHNTFSI